MDKVKYSIIFATCDRNDILLRTLQGYSTLICQKDLYEIIVVDNAVNQTTKNIVESFQETLPIKYLEQKIKGKNNALNKALLSAKGTWYIFTDDDAIPSTNWVSEISTAITKWPTYKIFGGAIKPYTEKWPEWIDISNPNIQSAFVIKENPIPYEEISPKAVWGPNMIVHSSLFNNDFNFNVNIGPSGANYIMGSETELLARLEQLGYKAMYLGKAIVYHQIREEQLTKEWVKGRAIRHGMGEGYKNRNALNAKQLFNMPRFEVLIAFKMYFKYLVYCLHHDKKSRLNYAYEVYVQLGKLIYFRNEQKCR